MGKKRQRSAQKKDAWIRTGVRWCWKAAGIGVVALALLFLMVGLVTDIPSFEELENPKSNLATEIISEDGVILGTYHIENRSFVHYDDLAPNLIYALLATEDVRFYSHAGIDFRSVGRVAIKTVMGGDRSSGGGSTISQQLALNLFSERSNKKIYRMLIQKPQEWITAVRLERNYTKEEIIVMYLNTVFFGSNAYGIRSAAATFFGKHPAHLTIEESALLVGVVNAPTYYSPVRNPERALQRRNRVLSQMAKYDYITQQECDSLQALPMKLNYQQQDHLAGLAPHFRDMLRRTMSAQQPRRENYRRRYEDYKNDSLQWATDPLYGWLNKNFKPDGSRYDLDRDGLRIHTTVNSRMQLYAEQSVAEHLRNDLQPAFTGSLRYVRRFPFSNDTELTQAMIDRILQQAVVNSERYKAMKAEDKSDKEIDAAFKTKTKMTVFSWKDKSGSIDTTMTPMDSILYYKSLLRASMIAIEPGTGFVRAYVGSPNYRYFKYDHVRQGRRQVGSTFKPFLYTLAMQQGMTPCDKVLNMPQSFIVGDTVWTPRSTDRAEWIGKQVTLKWGLTNSSNNISAYLMKQFGPQALINIAYKMGVHSELPWAYALCLGSCDLTLFEMVGAYNTFPSKGVHVDPFFVTRIEDKSGSTLATFVPSQSEALSDRTAYLTLNLLQGVVNEGTAHRLRRLYIPEGQIAGKTGTTNNQSDGWFIGFMPRLCAGVWVGAEDRSVHFESLTLGGGANMALPIWGLFMQKVLADPRLNVRTTDLFDIPPGMTSGFNCSGSDDEVGADRKEDDDFGFF